VLLAGVAAAAVLSFPRWGLGAAVVVAAATLAMGVGRRLPAAVSVAGASAAAAGFVHFAVAPQHFAEWWGFGAFFVVCGEVQLGWALLVRRVPGRLVLSVGLAGSLLLVVVWAVSRTSGLPLGPEPLIPEAVGRPDLLAVALELVTAGCCAWGLRRHHATTPFARPVVFCVLVVVATAAGWALVSIS